jgi:hypothetical protein
MMPRWWAPPGCLQQRVAVAIPTKPMPDQIQKPRPVVPGGPGGGGEGPQAPQVEKPNVDDLLKRMRKVDPDQARRYRQRTGE